jgi:Domain of unknown function (DUF932)
MNNLTTLGQVSDRVNEMSKNCYDKNVTVADISFDNLETVKIGNTQTHQLREIAQRSIAYRLGIPYQYLRKCPPDIQALNMNYWIDHEQNDELFFRYDGDDVRAIFTPKYKPVDNFEVIERLDSLGYGPDTQVQCKLDNEFMLLSIMDRDKAFQINGDRFRNGVGITNSEIGLASLGIAAFVLRLVCSNGMIRKTEIGASYRHVSHKILDEFPKVLENVSNELGRQKHQFRLSMESHVDDPLKTIESFNRQFQLKESERKAVVEFAWPYEMGNTMFNIVNTYTRASSAPDLSAESSYQLQRVGGNILGMLN